MFPGKKPAETEMNLNLTGFQGFYYFCPLDPLKKILQ